MRGGLQNTLDQRPGDDSFDGSRCQLDCNNNPAFVVCVAQISRTSDYSHVVRLTSSKTNR